MENLRKLRNERKLSMRSLGGILGLSESTISLYENGKREPDNKTLIKIANYFGVSTDYLLGNSTQPSTKYLAFEEALNMVMNLKNKKPLLIYNNTQGENVINEISYEQLDKIIKYLEVDGNNN